jgi:hypothetical protein
MNRGQWIGERDLNDFGNPSRHPQSLNFSICVSHFLNTTTTHRFPIATYSLFSQRALESHTYPVLPRSLTSLNAIWRRPMSSPLTARVVDSSNARSGSDSLREWGCMNPIVLVMRCTTLSRRLTSARRVVILLMKSSVRSSSLSGTGAAKPRDSTGYAYSKHTNYGM